MTDARLPYHPYANLLPMMSPAEREELKAAIARDGQRRPIVLDDTGILDGRNRYEVCLELGLVPRTRPYDPRPAPVGDGPDRLAFVLAENVERRHLDESQRAMVAARLANIGHGGERKPAEQAANLPLELSGTVQIDQATAAAMLKVSPRSLRDAKVVQDKGTPELRLAVDSGQLAVSAAKQAATLAPEMQRQIASDAAAGKANVVRTAIKQGARAERERTLGDKIAAMPEEKFGFIAEDPEWRFEPYSRATGIDRAADNHYPTSDDAALLSARAQEVAKLAADDCVHALWTTDLARGIDAMRARGFTPKSYFVWLKNLSEIELTEVQKKTGLGGRVFMHMGSPGTGFWNIDEDEILLIGTRGHPVCPAPGEQGSSVWYEPKRGHSVKPECFYAWVAKHFAHTPRIELNARHRRPGWQAWGNEVTPGNPEFIAFERAALTRGLIDAVGMVKIDDNRVVAFDFVTADEWRVMLASPAAPQVSGGDQADLDAALADPVLSSVLARSTPFPDRKIFTESTAAGGDHLDIPAFLKRHNDDVSRETPPADVPANLEA